MLAPGQTADSLLRPHGVAVLLAPCTAMAVWRRKIGKISQKPPSRTEICVIGLAPYPKVRCSAFDSGQQRCLDMCLCVLLWLVWAVVGWSQVYFVIAPGSPAMLLLSSSLIVYTCKCPLFPRWPERLFVGTTAGFPGHLLKLSILIQGSI